MKNGQRGVRKIDRLRSTPRIIALIGLATLGGCESGTTYGTSTRSASWTGNTGVPGIDDGTIASVKIWSGSDVPTEFAVWSDLPSQTGRSSSGHQGALVEWRLYAPDGRNVEVRYEAVGGKPGLVEVDGRRFNLVKGNLILIRTDRQPFGIKQIAFDLSRLPLDEAGATKIEDRSTAIRTLAESEPQIGDFFEVLAANPLDPEGPPARKIAGREDAIDERAIERIENRLDEGGADDSFPPYTELPVPIESTPVKGR